MYKIIIFFSLLTLQLFSATSQQVDQYMSTTHSDRALIELEKMFLNLHDSIKVTNENFSQDITLNYEIYLSKHLSESEMNELLALYRKPIMQQYINEMDTFDITKDEMRDFLDNLKEEPITQDRQHIINELIEKNINEELLIKLYNNLMQLDQNKSKKMRKTEEKNFLNTMKKNMREDLLYGTQTLSLDEMKKINELMSSSLIKKSIKVEHEAIIIIMNNFIGNVVSEPKNSK